LGFRADVEQILYISDLSVLCTNPQKHKEGVSNAILESMAIGVPVISTNDGGTPEIVKDNYNGFLIEAYNHEQLSQRIIQITEDINLRQRLSNGAIEIVQEKFALPFMVDQYEIMYKSLINSQ
jgi:glycosyltransferase involved in cell wall biosynthesis